MISARFYPGQLFFKPWAKWYRDILFKATRIYVQDASSVELLKSTGYTSFVLAGDTRFDRVEELSGNRDEFPVIEDFKGNEKLFIAGSSWPDDEDIITRYINRYPQKFKYIIAPHDVHKNHIKKIEELLKVPSQRYSAYDSEKPSRVLILDVIGKLSRIYKYASVAYIGGAFKEGLHNILEPAAYGVPVITGPDHSGFPEGSEMEKTGALRRIANFDEFEKLMNDWEENEWIRSDASSSAKRFVHQRTGSTEKIVKDIESLLFSEENANRESP